jgi:hypothetical protein
MKAFDSRLDSSLRDKGFDAQVSRNLSRDVDQTLRTQFGERQKLTVASNYFALACPIMPVGLLGAFMILDKLGGLSDEPGKTRAHELVKERGEAAQELYLAAIKQKQDAVEKSKLSISRQVETLTPITDKRNGSKPKRKDVALMLDGKRSERITGPVLLKREQQDIGKLVKEKMALQAHLEKLSELQDYHSVCRVSAQLDLLEKALKKLGA